MYSFHEIRKAAKHVRSEGDNQLKIAILGNCSTQFLATSIKGYACLEGLDVEIFDADYNQIDEQLIDTQSELYSFKPKIIILYLATYKLYESFLEFPSSDKSNFANEVISKLEKYWSLISLRLKCNIIQPNFTEIQDNALGNYGSKVPVSFTYQIRKLNYLLEEKMKSQTNVYPLDILGTQIQLGASVFYDSTLYYGSQMPIALDALPYVAKSVVDIIKSMNGKIKKCIICDLDNTLWGGVIGDDGIGGIEIGELGRGKAFMNFQKWLKQLEEFGILLVICSKNDEKIAKEPFEKIDEMPLKLKNFSVFVANWDDKAANIRLVQETLNLGMDSFVFVDDNPFERNLVRKILPEVEVPELPEDPAQYLEFLQNQNYFEVAGYIDAGTDRTAQYQAEYERKKLESAYSSIDDYLKDLEMVGNGRSFEPTRFARIAQLTQRSNQFNLRTVRYTEDDVKRMADEDNYITRYYTLRDKFGDHGLVGVVILEKRSETEAFIDTWLMSCRVLKRGMEEFIMNDVIDSVKTQGVKRLYAEYIPTAKNHMVEDIYTRFGFDMFSSNQFQIDVGEYVKRKTHIMEGQNG